LSIKELGKRDFPHGTTLDTDFADEGQFVTFSMNLGLYPSDERSMTYQSFKHLAALLPPYIFAACGKRGLPRYYRNARISPDVRLACAIPWFAAGSAYNIMTTYGISHTDTFISIGLLWMLFISIRHLLLCIPPIKITSALLLQVSLKCCQPDLLAVLGQ
jgi:hypothetical protein